MNKTNDSAAAEVTKNDPSTNDAGTADLELKKKKKETKKNKHKHSAERRQLKVLHRQHGALEAAIQRYEELREKSATKKKDGALKDKQKNIAKAIKVFRKESKKTPSDLLKAHLKANQLPKRKRKKWKKSLREMARVKTFKIM